MINSKLGDQYVVDSIVQQVALLEKYQPSLEAASQR
jgi:hypothetical protein